MKLPEDSGSSLESGRSLVSSAACLLGVLLGATACMQPPTQITVNANSSADKTNTNTENYSAQIESRESSSLVNTQAPPLPPARTPAPVQASVPSTPSFGTCYWNGAPEQCSAKWAGSTATVTWTSDGKVTRYDFAANTVYDSVNGRSYQATTSDIASGCISTANGTTCIYR